jgi:menaquinone-dependent protoporphyrinogen oxidase
VSARRVLVAYSSKRGSTREVAEAVGATLGEHGFDVDVRDAGSVDGVGGYSGVVLGGALYMGRLHSDARRFLRRHSAALGEIPVGVYAMGPKTLDEADVAGSRKQLDAALAKVPEVEPRATAIFGGVIDPKKLRFPFSRMPASDARDWEAIRTFADEVARCFEPASSGDNA